MQAKIMWQHNEREENNGRIFCNLTDIQRIYILKLQISFSSIIAYFTGKILYIYSEIFITIICAVTVIENDTYSLTSTLVVSAIVFKISFYKRNLAKVTAVQNHNTLKCSM